jgi:organic hydroperoxide reductase OsmC/OhrA
VQFALSVRLRVRIPEGQDNAASRELVKQAHVRCPYSKATRGNIPVDLIVE